jgi:hypothetical protein
MNKLLLCLSFLVFSVSGFSQRVYFIYLQTEQEQPFFLKMNEKVYSSSATGYLILSKLVDSTYSFTIGLPQSKAPEQKYTVPLKGKDHGFIIKDFGAKGWGLFDLQTLSIQMAPADASKSTSGAAEPKDVSPFTEILARVADDPSLRVKPAVRIEEVKQPEKAIVQEKKEETKPVVGEPVAVKKEEPKKEEPKKVEAAPVVTDPPLVKKEEPKTELKPVVTDLPLAKKDEPKPDNKDVVAVRSIDSAAVKTEVKEGVVKPDQPARQPELKVVESNTAATDVQKPVEAEYKKGVVTRKFGKTTAEGIGLMFIDEYGNGLKDTIHILIPDIKPAAEKKEAPKQEKKFLDINSSNDSAAVASNDNTKTASQPVTEPEKNNSVAAKPAPKNNCKVVATETDFLKLRKNMAAETDDDDMVDEARKYFRNKCFTTQQIKNLSALFLDDLGKYKFFDLAYIFVFDAENFSSLQAELKNEYYVNRFKAMLK